MRKNSISDSDPISKEEGVKIMTTVKKNHCVPRRNPYVKVPYYAIYDQGIERYLPMINQLVEQGVLEKRGAFIKDVDPATGEPKEIDGYKYQWQGAKNLRQYLIDNPAYYDELFARMNGEVFEQLSEEEQEALKQEEREMELATMKQAKQAKDADKKEKKASTKDVEANAKADAAALLGKKDK